MHKTTFGFAARITGGNVKAALLSGLPVGRLIVLVCFFAGAGGGLAGMIEVAAVHGSANSSLNANYGYTGILVAFVARHNPIAIIPVAILLGGIRSSSGLLQRAQDLPDATVLVLQGIVFVVILFSETLYGRFRIFQQNGVPPHR
jgi:simple sugar transport system permease protein